MNKDTYTSAALRGFGKYNEAALKGCGNYNDAALIGFGNYNDAAIRGFGRLKKGSKEAKARMAYLRSLKGKGSFFKNFGRALVGARVGAKKDDNPIKKAVDSLRDNIIRIKKDRAIADRVRSAAANQNRGGKRIRGGFSPLALIGPAFTIGKLLFRGIKKIIEKKKAEKEKGGACLWR